ncbi:ABC transporter substrate-binding protein [Rufibacter sediminis]|uniref:ABC transporter substrate-binding protein n=1 Tax=Rufibacter sediminis TaxID=2762756 RepID=A0ABR6VLU4_9BACT|nr:ABC transporter substrate-binding protein [Rufibacter sediminis]MBC3538153.1 ABC transporter substrate-binding protein [Rufibacter sediminis]
MKKRIVLAVAGVALCWNVQAQSTSDLDTRLQNGRLLVDQEKYALAMAELLPIASTATGKSYAPDAAYLYSVAASRQKKLAEADKMLTQLTSEHTNWGGLADAQYLHGQVLFEKKEYLRALKALEPIDDKSLKDEVAAMKRYYMLQLTDKATFQYLMRQFPEDATLARAYADKLVTGWFTEADRPQLETLVRQFNLDRSYLQRSAAVKKDAYNVAVLLPFNVTDQGVKVDKKNLYITDFYAGLLSARDSLQKEGVQVNVFPYDTSNDTAQVRTVMELPEMSTMDLVIGPIFKGNSAFAAKIAQQRNLNMVNPFSDDADITKGNPYLYLMEASVATQGQRAATYAYQTFPRKTAVLVYDSEKNDTVFAGNFRRTFTALGGKVVSSHKINSKTSGNVGGILGAVNLKDLGVLVVQSSAANVATGTISFLEQRASKVPVIAPQAWLENPQISFAQFDFLEMYFTAPKFIDQENPSVQNFKRAYTSRYNLPPSTFTYTGFELLHYYGRQLKENGYSAPPKLSRVQPGTFYQGVGYEAAPGKQAQDNQYLPLIKVENGRLLVVNPVL